MTKARTLADFDTTSIPASLLTGALPALNGSALTNLPAGGITEADQWRITAEFTGNATPIASNWERNDDMFGVLGTGMTESSGVFTFPSTGVYLVTFQFIHQFDQADAYTLFDIEGCTDGSSFNRISRHHMAGDSGYHRSGYCNAIVDINNTTTHKVRFTVSDANASNSTKGATGEQQTGATFIRLSDT
jgi:hypothetical protein